VRVLVFWGRESGEEIDLGDSLEDEDRLMRVLLLKISSLKMNSPEGFMRPQNAISKRWVYGSV